MDDRENYELLDMEVIVFTSADVITMSGDPDPYGGDPVT